MSLLALFCLLFLVSVFSAPAPSLCPKNKWAATKVSTRPIFPPILLSSDSILTYPLLWKGEKFEKDISTSTNQSRDVNAIGYINDVLILVSNSSNQICGYENLQTAKSSWCFNITNESISTPIQIVQNLERAVVFVNWNYSVSGVVGSIDSDGTLHWSFLINYFLQLESCFHCNYVAILTLNKLTVRNITDGSEIFSLNFTCYSINCRLYLSTFVDRLYVMVESSVAGHTLYTYSPNGTLKWTHNYPTSYSLRTVTKFSNITVACYTDGSTIILESISDLGASIAFSNVTDKSKVESTFTFVPFQDQSLTLLHGKKTIGTDVIAFNPHDNLKKLCSTSFLVYLQEGDFVLSNASSLYLIQSSPFILLRKSVTFTTLVFEDIDTIWDSETISFVVSGGVCLMLIAAGTLFSFINDRAQKSAYHTI
eukprot:TRINITY_DN9617_c0_g1_i1.p1 TRINITY_DN9617_c0_g1~~TRINITY_DN9617_c0_g1_i1.p1  ORF type:complete len:424 (-),score=32.01 TRINITY_DN9617_c0_g1_i1:64-1335(-)